MNILQFLLLAILFVVVVGVVMVGNSLLESRRNLRERLRQVGEHSRNSTFREAQVDAEATGMLHRLVSPMAKLATPDTEEEITHFRAKFLNAGIRSRSAPVYFFAAKVLLALVLPALAWMALQAYGSRLQGQMVMALLLTMAAFGYYLPNGILANLAARRQRELFEAFPDAIDLMIVCMEAGLSMDMALQRTSREMALRSAALAEELTLVGVEMRVGSTRERALRNLALRTGVDEINMFVAMLLQADRFGTSIGESMRVHAEDLRLRREMRAEEQAVKLPTKLLFPLMFTIFPAMLLVLLGPAFLGLMRNLFPAMMGQR